METSSINWVHMKKETESSIKTLCVYIKIHQWIMSENIIFVLMYYCHKLLDLNLRLVSKYNQI
jgi:hypothetical protein